MFKDVCGNVDSHEWTTWHNRVQTRAKFLREQAIAKGKTLSEKASFNIALTLIEAEHDATVETETQIERDRADQRQDRLYDQKEKLLSFLDRRKAHKEAKAEMTTMVIDQERQRLFEKAEKEASVYARPAANQKRGDRGTKDPQHINYQDPDQFKWTIAHKAVNQNDLDALQKAIKLGADLTIRDKSGWTPYQLALYTNKQNIIQFLDNLENHGAEEIKNTI